MLHIILLLLRIILCVVLVLIAAVILSVAAVLAVPVRYRVNAERFRLPGAEKADGPPADDEEGSEMSVRADAEASWFMHFVRAYISYDMSAEEDRRLHINVKIAGHCLFDNLAPQDRGSDKNGKKVSPASDKGRQGKESGKSGTEEKTKETVSAHMEEETGEAAGAHREEETKETSAVHAETEAEESSAAHPETESKESSAVHPETETEESSASRKEETKKKTGHSGITDRVKSLAGIPKKIRDRVNALLDRIAGLCEKRDKLLEIYNDGKNHKWFVSAFVRLRKLIIGLLPHIDLLRLHFGMKDPATTGQVLGYLSMLYGVYDTRMELEPEFGEEIMEGEVRIRGRVRIGDFVYFGIRTFLNRRFFIILKQIRQINQG